MPTFPNDLAADRYPGRMRRELVVENWCDDGRLMFLGSLHDRWLPDRDSNEEPYDLHRYEVTVETVPPALEIVAISGRPMVLPYTECPLAVKALDQLVGTSLARGFRRHLTETLGGVEGCTHLLTVLDAISKSQVIAGYLIGRPAQLRGEPRPAEQIIRMADVCRGYRADGESHRGARAGLPYLPQWTEGQPVAVDVPYTHLRSSAPKE